MSELIGAAGPHFFTTSLKQELLFFDRIAYPQVDVSLRWLRDLPDIESTSGFINELEWLLEKDIVFDPYKDYSDKAFPLSPELANILNTFSQLHRATLTRAQTAREGSPHEAMQVIDQGVRDLQGWAARMTACVLRHR